MAVRVCACVSCAAHPGSCPELTTARRCPACSSETEQRRGRRQARGYGPQHDAARQRLVAAFIPGTLCPKCQAPMWDTSQLDAGHSVDLRTNPDAVADQLECRPCNRGWRRSTT